MLELLLLSIPILYAIANLADKWLVHGDEEDSNPGALLALSGLFASMFAIPLGIFIILTGRDFGDAVSILMLIAIGGLFFAAMYIYLDMLKVEDSSCVVAWFQIVPLFGVVGAFFFLGESPEWYHIVAIVLLVIGGFMISYNNGNMKKTIIFWMIVASLLLALYDVFFASYGRGIDELSAIFFMLLGKMMAGAACLLFDRETRIGFMIGLRTKLKAQFVSESINTLADMAMYASLLFFPVIIVQGVTAVQPLFVLIGAAAFGGIFPEIKEEFTGKDFRKKVIAMTLLILGGILLT